MQASVENPPMPWPLRAVIIVSLLVLMGGATLLFAPDLLGPRWLWSLTPFNLRFLGAVYIAEAAAGLALLGIGRWAPARVAVPQAAIFTLVISVVSAWYFDRFNPARRATVAWFILYIVPTLILLYYVWRDRRKPPAEARPTPLVWRALLVAEMIVIGLYGLALLVAPAASGSFWPWPLDDFHARMYSSVFLATAAGSWLLVREGAASEFLVNGIVHVVLGLGVVFALFAVDVSARVVNYAAFGTWLWLALFGGLAAMGFALLGWAAVRSFGERGAG